MSMARGTGDAMQLCALEKANKHLSFLSEGLRAVVWAPGRPHFTSLLWAPEPGPQREKRTNLELERPGPRIMEPQL